MNKKVLFTGALFALSSVAFFSCKDDNNGGTSEVSVPKTSVDAQALVNAVYRPLQAISSSYSFLLESATETTVCFEEKDETIDGPQVAVFETSKTNWYPTKVFGRLYQSIAQANLAIDKIGEADSSKINSKSASKELLIARAQFVRGYNYFQLVQIFGEVPIITSSNPAKADQITRKSIDDVYQQAVNDLTEAIKVLPEYSSAKYQPSKLAAKTILAKLYLTWGQKPLTQDQVAAIATAKQDPAKPEVDRTKLQLAYNYASEVIGSGKYQLRADYNAIWGVGNEGNEEVIYSIEHFGDGVDEQGNHQTHCGFTFPKSERTDPHIQWADITFENAIPEGDARRLYSFSTYVSYQDGNADTLTWPLSVVRPGKWIHRDGTGTTKALDIQPNNIDHIDFRLAEVYLIKAEAAYYLDKPEDAVVAINALRLRAGVDDITSTNGTALETDIQKEWFYELAFEQKHWLNLVRWRTLIQSVNKVKDYEYYKEDYTDQVKFNAIVYNGIKADPTRFPFYKRINLQLHRKVNNVDGHHYRFPIPSKGLDKETNLGIEGQNPGY